MEVRDSMDVSYLFDKILSEVISKLKELLEKYGDGEIEYNAYEREIKLFYYREETSEEKRVRLLREEGIAKSEAKNKEKRRRQYEALKKEFEGESKRLGMII